MPRVSLNSELLKTQAPNAWQDIILCFDKNTEGFPKNQDTSFENLPFVLQLGVFKQYFNENGIDIDFNNLEIEELCAEITRLVLEHENTVKHYS